MWDLAESRGRLPDVLSYEEMTNSQTTFYSISVRSGESKLIFL